MNKKTKIIVSTIFAIILLVLGLFWFANNKNGAVQGKVSDYKIAGGKVANSKAGVSYNVPEGWSAEKLDYDQGSVIIYSPETDVKKTEDGAIELPIGEGCLIETGVVYKKYEIADIKLESLYYNELLNATSTSFESVTLDGIPAIKHVLESQKTGRANLIHAPKNGKVYNFSVYLPINGDQNKCLEDFGNFLGTVSIK